MTNETAAQSGMALSRVNLREAFVVPASMERFVGDLTRLAQTPLSQAASLTAETVSLVEQSYGFEPQDCEDERRKPFIYSNGVAVVSVHGTLLNRFPYSWGFVTGYASIRKQINAIKADKAANPDDVQLVVFDHDSPGGESAGCQELAHEIAALGEIVPTIAIVDSLCCSASYMLAVPCNRVIAIPSATVGSIGVYRLHIDLSGAYSQAGIKFTYVKSGEHKVDGNPFEPLGAEVETDWQKSVDKSRLLFAQFVAEQTGLSVESVMETEARTYKADEALDIKLISGVMTPSEAVSAFLQELADDEIDPEDGDEEMKEVTSGQPAAAPAVASAPVIDQAALSAVVASALASQRTADRQRASTVRQHDAAKANMNLANHLLDNTEMDAASIIASCEAAGPAAKAEESKPELGPDGKPKAAAPGGGVDTVNHLEAAMSKTGVKTPGAGAEHGEGGGGDGGGERTDADISNDLIASYSLASGRKLGDQGKAH